MYFISIRVTSTHSLFGHNYVFHFYDNRVINVEVRHVPKVTVEGSREQPTDSPVWLSSGHHGSCPSQVFVGVPFPPCCCCCLDCCISLPLGQPRQLLLNLGMLPLKLTHRTYDTREKHNTWQWKSVEQGWPTFFVIVYWFEEQGTQKHT
jgi:hypothetical protein